MKRGGSTTTNDEETETETIDDDLTESEESRAHKKLELFGFPLQKLSYKRLPKKCLKFWFITVNTMTFLSGVSAIVISIWMLADSKLMLRLTGQKMFVTILLMIGIFVASVSSMGMYAFTKRKRRLLTVYVLLHALFLCFIFFFSIMSSSFFDFITDKIHEDMKDTIMKYRVLDWVTEAWDNTQQYLKCCGIKSYEDWTKYRMEIPQSCCSKSIKYCLQMTNEIAFESGCMKSAYVMLRSHIDSVAFSTILVSMISGVSLFLALGIKRRFRVSRYIEEP